MEIIGAYVAICALVIAFAEVRNSLQANQISREDSQNRAELELAKVTADLKDIEGEVLGGDRNLGKREGPAANIAVTVRNLETAPSFISKATLVFSRGGYLEGCYSMGGGLSFTGQYTFKVPDGQPLQKNRKDYYLYRVPFSLSAELTHKIPPNDYEKFMLSVGPQTVSVADSPWYGVMDVVLEHDGGKELRFGPIAVISPGSGIYPSEEKWTIEPSPLPDWRKCMKRNAELVAEVMDTPGLVASTEFTSLDESLDEYR
ncbi:hypothetical protein [Streptomyces sp. NPDC101178]|uniref:hypothetical protein n=1 Tax=Streptomyces sp. NPDC101178 TaxID=3366124 RepID=UPI003817B4AE